MAVDLSGKRIIMIHGLASKPPRDHVHRLWSKCVVENIRCTDKPLARALESAPDVMGHAYWADAVPHHIPDDPPYVRKLEQQVDKVIAERRKVGAKFHVPMGEKVGGFFKDRGVDLVKVLAGALSVKDEVMRSFLRETELYDQDQYIADQIREPLEGQLREAWNEGQEVALLSHSMGTFISYDVLWQFSHRRESDFWKYRNQRVQMFVTMGSPLGDPTVRGLLFARHHKKDGKRQFPTNIDRWHNYACLGDVVSHQHDFESDFFDEMKDLEVLPSRPKHRAIDYANLHNPFEVVSHKGNKGSEKRNPHKSYGYLVQPRLGSWLADFLRGKLK
jgi:hypothetical protein